MIGVLMIDFGGPRGDAELVPFLARLLADVLPGPAWLRAPLGAALARRRAPRVAPAYRQIGWSPLVATHEAQVAALRTALGPDAPPIASGMLFTAPEIEDGLVALRERGVDRLVAMTMFPHFSRATAGAGFTFLAAAMQRTGLTHWPVHRVPAWPDEPGYIAAVADHTRAALDALPGAGPVHLVFSPHGLPVRWVRELDPYPDQVRATIRLVTERLGWEGPTEIGWQSRVGPSAWLAPSTSEVVRRLGAEGVTRAVIVPVAFASEHVETLYELDVEIAAEARHAGLIHVGRARAPGTHPAFIDGLANAVRRGIARFGKPSCVRCLGPRPSLHVGAASCRNCGFRLPPWAAT
jgi:ferrochelatase